MYLLKQTPAGKLSSPSQLRLSLASKAPTRVEEPSSFQQMYGTGAPTLLRPTSRATSWHCLLGLL